MKSPIERLVAMFGPQRALVTPDALTAYECDAFTLLKHRPLAVVLPESTQEVAAAVKLLHAEGVPFLPRGAGTCLSGGVTPSVPTVIIETARMNKILEVDAEDLLAIVQPGVINLHLTEAVSHLGLHYAPDPSSQSVCTIGGNAAENSGGPHCFKYGMTTDHLLGLTVVLPDGEIAKLGSTLGPRAPHELDLLGAFVGSEGTFGIATEIAVRLSPNQPSIRTLLGAFPTMASACAAVSDIVVSGLVPAALEIIDRASIEAIEASVYRAGYPTDAEAVLLVEIDGAEIALREEAREIKDIFARQGVLSTEDASDPEDRARLWKGRKGAFGAMGRLNTDLYVLDGVVPRTRLVETLERFREIAETYGVTMTNVFHAGDGNLHPNISYDGRNEEEKEKVLAAGWEILQHCVAVGGSITGEHGVGQEKLEHVPLMFSPDDLDVMERLRRVFNPQNLCNPGKALPERNSCAEVAKWPQMVDRVLQQEEGDAPRL